MLAYFDGRIEAVIDGGPCGIGRESTVLDMSETPYRIIRPGALPQAAVEEALVSAMKILGITGGTGVGKTTALNVLRDMGGLIIDCDAVYHNLTDTDPGLRQDIETRFGPVYKNGRLDRKFLRNK